MKELYLNRRNSRLTVYTVCYLFVFLFVYAAISKFIDYERFTIQMGQSPLLTSFAGYLGWIVPVSEIIIAVFLLFRKTRLIGLYASFFIMVLFTGYIFIILNLSDFVPCSCGGILENMSWHQHLVFNLIFILLAGGALLLSTPTSRMKTSFKLLGLVVIGFVSLVLLNILSENKVYRNNSFIRRYPPAAAVFKKAVDLTHNSWYLAGIGNNKIYLANSTAPLNIKVFDTALRIIGDYRIKLNQMDLPFSSVKITVKPPYFYVADGSVPVIFRGKTTDWEAQAIMRDSIFFTASTLIDSSKTAVRFVGAKSAENEIGIIKSESITKFNYNEQLLEKQIDGLFDTDGQLLWNEELKQLLYIYFYRNEYLVVTPDLKLIRKGKTIDTISKAQLKVATTSDGQLKLASPSYPINKYAACYSNNLYVQSDRLGRFEPKEMLQEASIIDVYNISENTYRYSFYVYNYKNKKMSSFMVKGKKLVGILDRYMVVYEIR